VVSLTTAFTLALAVLAFPFPFAGVFSAGSGFFVSSGGDQNSSLPLFQYQSIEDCLWVRLRNRQVSTFIFMEKQKIIFP